MRKIYFAGKFNLTKDKNVPLCERLINDFRVKILGDPIKLTHVSSDLYLNDKYQYIGPFYCEQASNGDFTSTDCNVVLNAEYEAVISSDVYLAVFDENFSVGTVVELGWALRMDKEIVIFYKEEDSDYEIKSEYWFAIADALKRGKKVKVYKFNNIDTVINQIKEGSCF
jgi:nucleoside 2-deoxyribosyltransferase